MPLADRAIGNLQQWLIGTYHGVSKAQLQVYLDEFVFRHNRRRQPMAAFQTLLGLGTGRAPTPYRRIRGARDVAARRLIATYWGLLKQPDKQERSFPRAGLSPATAPGGAATKSTNHEKTTRVLSFVFSCCRGKSPYRFG